MDHYYERMPTKYCSKLKQGQMHTISWFCIRNMIWYVFALVDRRWRCPHVPICCPQTTTHSRYYVTIRLPCELRLHFPEFWNGVDCLKLLLHFISCARNNLRKWLEISLKLLLNLFRSARSYYSTNCFIDIFECTCS